MNKVWHPKYPLDVVYAIKKAMPHRSLRSKEDEGVIAAVENTPEEKLMYTTTEAQDTLLTASTIFPLTFFPDTINIDREKLTIVHRSFFRSAEIISVEIRDIISVKSNVGPFFGSIVLSSKYFVNSIQNINFLLRNDVIKLQRLIQGSLIAHHKKIDCTNIEKSQLVTLLSDLGQGAAA